MVKELHSLSYRRDIDGLRAIAILSVIGYHAFPTWITGGFAGVDIFFVISGFLISNILLENLERNTFSFKVFYARRIRRIFPALIIVLAASYVLGWFVLLADEYKQLGKHIAGASLFSSNFILWRETGYFDIAAEIKPLLHLWSLGIEEQFYIVWPLLLYGAWRWRINLSVIILFILIGSFLLNVGRINTDATAVFYSPFPRAWELLAGAYLARFILHKPRWFVRVQTNATLLNVLSVIGGLLVMAAILGISRDKAFPGWWALLPTLGTVLIISAGSTAWLNRQLLSAKLAVWFGLISYPLYLWHWPLLSFAHIMESGLPALWIRIAIIVISITLAWLTFNFIEKPIRLRKPLGVQVFLFCSLMLIMGIIGGVTFIKDGYPARNAELETKLLDLIPHRKTKQYLVENCAIQKLNVNEHAVCLSDNRETPIYVLLGDSHAQSLFPGLIDRSQAGKRWGMLSMYSCPPITDFISASSDKHAKDCGLFNKLAIDAIVKNNNIKLVLIAIAYHEIEGKYISIDGSQERNDALEIGLSNTIKKLELAKKKVIMLVDNPNAGYGGIRDCVAPRPFTITRQHSEIACFISREKHEDSISKFRILLRHLKEKHVNVLIYDPTDIFCDKDCNVMKNGRSLYSYGDHMSDYAAEQVAGKLNEYLMSHDELSGQ